MNLLKSQPTTAILIKYLSLGRNVLDMGFKIEGNYVVDDKSECAWGISPDVLRRMAGKVKLALVIAEETAVPISIEGEKKWDDSHVKSIALDRYRAAMVQGTKDQRRQLIVKGFIAVAILLVLLVAIVIVAGLVQNGSLDVKSPV